MRGVLYLAEVQKKGGGLLGGGGKAELKLLACQRSEQSWSAVPGEESIPAEDASDYASGTLVLVDLTNNKQVRNVQPAARQLVSILQNFSRQQEKFKTQEAEIEQWKESLTYQSQELNRREMEMESRQEQLQQMEADFEQFEQQRQDLQTQAEQMEQQKTEYERNRQELDGAWSHLRGEMRRLEERQAEIQPPGGLGDEQTLQVQELLQRLASATLPTTALQEHVTIALDILGLKQGILTQHWQTLEQQQGTAQQIQGEVEHQAQELQQGWQAWHQAQDVLVQAQAAIRVQEGELLWKQEQSSVLELHLQNQVDLQRYIDQLGQGIEGVKIENPVDVAALEKLSLDELQRMTTELEQDLKKLSQFVASQEEELVAKQQELDELQAKIQAANEFDRMNLENELADERDGYQMLNETLVGQRRSLREREWIVNTHRSILNRRQGFAEPATPENGMNMAPLLDLVDTQRQQCAEALDSLHRQLEQARGAIQQAHELMAGQMADQERQRQELKEREQTLIERRAVVAETWGRVNLYQEMLRPVQDQVDALRQRLEELAGTMAQAQEMGSQQVQALDEMRQILVSVAGMPEMAAS